MTDDLVKRLRIGPSMLAQGQAANRIEELEAKLAKAVEALEKLNVGEGWAAQIACPTIAELKGDRGGVSHD